MAALLRRSRALPADPVVANEARSHVVAGPRLSPVEQLEIYREQFWLRHTASLLEDFPGLSGILGQADWERLVESYLGVVVPTSWTLRDLGYRLPAHVERATSLPNHALCVDMARLEWAMVELFDAEDAPPLDADRLARVPEAAWETARIALSPSLSLLHVGFPVAELRVALRERRESAVAIPAPGEQWLVLYRDRELALRDAAVPRAAFELLAALRDGLPLGQAAEQVASALPDAASEIEAKVGEWFSDFGVRGWVVDVQER